MAQDVRHKVEKTKKRDVYEENISKLNLDEEISNDEIELICTIFHKQARKIAMVPTGRRSQMKK